VLSKCEQVNIVIILFVILNSVTRTINQFVFKSCELVDMIDIDMIVICSCMR